MGRDRPSRKNGSRGQTELVLGSEALLRRLFAIIPPRRWHLTRYHGIFSGHHSLRRKIAALLPEAPARVTREDIGRCERCGGELRLVACIDDPDTVTKILTHLGLPTDVRKVAPARSPPQAELPNWGDLR